MAKISPTQRALKVIKQAKLPYSIVEKWNHHVQIRQDMFGIFDLVIIVPNQHIMAVQVTTFSNRSARQEKMIASPYLSQWLSTGAKAQLWTYRITKKETGFVYDSFDLIDNAIMIQTRGIPFDFIA